MPAAGEISPSVLKGALSGSPQHALQQGHAHNIYVTNADVIEEASDYKEVEGSGQ